MNEPAVKIVYTGTLGCVQPDLCQIMPRGVPVQIPFTIASRLLRERPEEFTSAEPLISSEVIGDVLIPIFPVDAAGEGEAEE